MAYNRKQLITNRRNEQIKLRERHPDWSGEQIYFELQRKHKITRITAERDWKAIRDERAKQAEQEGGDDGHEGQSTAN